MVLHDWLLALNHVSKVCACYSMGQRFAPVYGQIIFQRMDIIRHLSIRHMMAIGVVSPFEML